jgi:hypothetical protein
MNSSLYALGRSRAEPRNSGKQISRGILCEPVASHVRFPQPWQFCQNRPDEIGRVGRFSCSKPKGQRSTNRSALPLLSVVLQVGSRWRSLSRPGGHAFLDRERKSLRHFPHFSTERLACRNDIGRRRSELTFARMRYSILRSYHDIKFRVVSLFPGSCPRLSFAFVRQDFPAPNVPKLCPYSSHSHKRSYRRLMNWCANIRHFSLTPCFSKVRESAKRTSTVLTVSHPQPAKSLKNSLFQSGYSNGFNSVTTASKNYANFN